MRKTLIFGNSASGKSTLAKTLFTSQQLPHLDLDTIAWLDQTPPQRTPLDVANNKIKTFTAQHSSWVIEGCYANLLALLATEANEIIFMNLSPDLCMTNAKNRPWEPHKYPTKQAQDKNLAMLLDWIALYQSRTDDCSLQAHQDFYRDFEGKKFMYTENGIKAEEV